MSENKTLNTVSNILTEAKRFIKEAFNVDPQSAQIEIIVDSELTKLINRLAALGGGTMFANDTQTFGPITEFMGEKIFVREGVKEEDITATLDEKQLFISQVDKMEKLLPSVPAETIATSYTLPDDVTVLRGVAKRAGLDDYEEADINTAYILKIQEGLHLKAERARGEQEAESKVTQEQSKKPDIVLSDEEKKAIADDLQPDPVINAPKATLSDLETTTIEAKVRK